MEREHESEDDNGNISNEEEDNNTISPHIRDTLLEISNQIRTRRENESVSNNQAHESEINNEVDNETISNSSDEIEVFI
tara:strand:- start:694 stop:930 length:237 start_codon:yes stop_codon:yes gene_type:complete